jgi:hypothetical protein
MIVFAHPTSAKPVRRTPARRHRQIARVQDALDQLRLEHEMILRLLRDFDRARLDSSCRPAAKAEIVEQLCDILSLHAQLKDQVLYPAARRLSTQLPAEQAQTAFCDHEQLHALIAELDEMEPQDPDYDETVAELGDCVVPSLKAEQAYLFPELRAAGLDTHALGAEMARLRRAQQKHDFTRVGLPRARPGSASNTGAWPPACRLSLS